ncbi:hypothetical protein [Microbacterium hydrocarbonoxydans]|uniref:Gram-positive cocci surface proteins LPxTG domain-containing protein n=1 Tax=Microbacterium hydrocarbonoxydans TaxID=273678 RepID=A0A1H4JXP5_9MICO|nr:hypothetical protein [Microbacterium hydrocarbonoxydans]SEB50927.1 hypothetical protein SAMN04489807_1097 [Microbacterium hydrocarbonoxydans]
MSPRRIVTAVGAAAALGVLAAAPAWAAPSTQVVQGEVLRLVSSADWDAASSLLPGQPVRWDVTVSAEAPDPGTVAVGISATGDAALLVDVALCAQPWSESGCAGGATLLKTDWALPLDGVENALLDMSDEDVAHLRFTVTLGDGGGSTRVRVHASGAGESAVIGPEGGLATTGGTGVPVGVLATGLGLVAVGTALSASRRRRRLRSDRRVRP